MEWPWVGIFRNSFHLRIIQQNPPIFSVSFWINQDPTLQANSAIISHINHSHNAGWSFERIWQPVDHLEFSVASTNGDLFTAQSPISAELYPHCRYLRWKIS